MHDHAPATGDARRRLLATSLALTSVVFFVQVIGAILSGSLALLADAVHMLADVAALIIALIASVVAARPANDRRTFGYRRAEVFGALINGVLLIGLSVWVAVEGIVRVVAPEETEVAAGLMLTVAIVGLLANAVAMWLLSAAQRTSINVRSAYLEVMGDLIGSAAVIVAALVILFTGWAPADAIASLLIAAMIIPRAIRLLKEVAVVLLEGAPKGIEVADIRRHILQTPGVVSVHDVHVWQLTRGAPVFTAHVIVSDEAMAAGAANDILMRLQSCLSEHFDVEHSTFQIESAAHREHDDAQHP